MIIEKIKELAQNTPDNVCYKIDNDSITYKELYFKIKTYSNYLKRQGNSPIIIYGHKNIDMYVSIFSCIMAKRNYVPIDSFTPKERIKTIISLTNSKLLIKNQNIIIDTIETLTLDELIKYKNNDIVKNNNEIAYTIFTSGSTGIPKGVPISYENLNNFIKWINKVKPLNTYKNITVLNQASFSFDLSVCDIFYSIINSHKLVSFNKTNYTDLEFIYNTIKNNKINLIVATPTFIKMCLLDKIFNKTNLPNLKCIFFCGELLETKLVKKIFERFPNLSIINAYGPSEATCAVSAIKITPKMLKEIRLPVGNILTSANKIVIEDNEIIIKGKSVFNGYLNNITGGYYKENNVNCFKTGDAGYIENNKLYYIDRIDNQIKLNGYRIELLEIETQIKNIKGIKDAVVVAKRKNGIVKYINAFIITNDITCDIIRKKLSEKLPNYMIPKFIKNIDTFPVNSNGKTDRKKLSELC